MIKHETITIGGTVIYCDGCGLRGHQEAYDNGDDVIDSAEREGWSLDPDLCPECRKKAKPAAKSRKRKA